MGNHEHNVAQARRAAAYLEGFTDADQQVKLLTHSVLAYEAQPDELVKAAWARAYWAEQFARVCAEHIQSIPAAMTMTVEIFEVCDHCQKEIHEPSGAHYNHCPFCGHKLAGGDSATDQSNAAGLP